MNRSNAYYLARMRDEHPAIYADYLAKKFKNASEAIRSAGLKKAPSPLDALRTAWAKATSAEQATFVAEIGCASSTTATIVTPLTPIAGPELAIHSGGYLTPATVQPIKDIMSARGITQGTVMREIGYKPLNACLGRALGRGDRIHDESMLDALENWLAKQAP